MPCTKSQFDKLPDKREIDKYTLVNSNGTEASFLNLGAVWNEMKVKDRDGKTRDVILGFDHAGPYLTDSAFFGAVVGRNANRIGGARFTLNGKEYRLGVNDNANNLHSGPDFYRNRIWQVRTEETAEGESLVFSLESPDMDQGFPGNAKIEVRYTLTDQDEVRIQYDMVCDQDTVANFTNHCYFNLAGQESGPAMSQEVWIDADYFTPTDKYSIPTGDLASVKGTPMDLNQWKMIGEEIDCGYIQLSQAGGYDHNWALKESGGASRLVAKARDKESGIGLEVYTDLPGVQFYTGNYIVPGTVGKGGAVYEKRQGYCFETQYFPNAVNEKNFQSPIVKAGERYHTETIYRFVTE